MCLAGAAAVATVPPHSWWCSAFARALSGEEIQRGESKTYREEKEASTTSEIVRLKSIYFSNFVYVNFRLRNMQSQVTEIFSGLANFVS